MLLSKKEMILHEQAAKQIMKSHGLKAMFLIGDRMPGNNRTGDFQYFTNNYVLNYRQCVIFFPDSEPVLLSGGWIQTQAAQRNCWINDLRSISNAEALLKTLPSVLKERNVTSGAVGTNFDQTSLAVVHAINSELPDVELVEIHPDIMKYRLIRSEEEQQISRKCAALCDGAYEHIRKIIKPGITENQIRGELERYMISNGAEDCFNLVSSGRYSIDAAKNTLGLPYTPDASMKTISSGDTVVMELTPRYDCYWTQMVRYVSVLEENKDLQKVHDVTIDIIRAGKSVLKPGVTIAQLASAMKDYAAKITSDFTLGGMGHVCGLDLTEFVISTDCNVVLNPGMTIILHPTLYTSDGNSPIFWGETYMITNTGWECLSSADKQLYIT